MKKNLLYKKNLVSFQVKSKKNKKKFGSFCEATLLLCIFALFYSPLLWHILHILMTFLDKIT